MAIPLTVIIPTHDRPAGLERTVRSLLGQSEKPMEIVIIHDGSSPAPQCLPALCNAAGVSLAVHRRRHPSLPASRNLGLDVARGEIALMLEDDATLPDDYLRRLGELWSADTERRIAAIGSRIREARTLGTRGRLWKGLAKLSCHLCWRPRRCRARYVSLPRALGGRLQPAGRLHGAGTSLRVSLARQVRYDDTLSGYAYGEDREFSFRLSQRHPTFIAPELIVLHAPAEVTPESLGQKGRTYVINSLRTARRCTEGGAGLWLLVAMDLAGTAAMFALLSLVGKNRHARRAFVGGLVRQVIRQGIDGLGRWRCGC